MKILILFISLTLTNCAVNQTSDVGKPLWTARADLGIQLGDTNFTGMGVTKAVGNIPIQFSSPVGIDRVQITTCARQHVCQSGGICDPEFQINKNWLGTVQNNFVYNYQPVTAEREIGCNMYVETFSKSNLTSWGYVGFRTDEALPAHSECNGEGVRFSGMTTCQSKAGLEQTISFDGPVKAIAEANCHMSTADQITYKVKPDLGFCRVTFARQDSSGKIIYHRAVFLGFDSVLLRVN